MRRLLGGEIEGRGPRHIATPHDGTPDLTISKLRHIMTIPQVLTTPPQSRPQPGDQGKKRTYVLPLLRSIEA